MLNLYGRTIDDIRGLQSRVFWLLVLTIVVVLASFLLILEPAARLIERAMQVEMMKGTIQVESQVGRGTTFFFNAEWEKSSLAFEPGDFGSSAVGGLRSGCGLP